MIAIYQDKNLLHVSLTDLQQITGVHYLPGIEFLNYKLYLRIEKLTRGVQLDLEHSWLSAYFRKEVLNRHHPNVSLRWIGDQLGWGIFAEEPLEPQKYIAEYAGIVRKRVKQDRKNAYCFEYPIGPGIDSPYVIDAQEIGGISRYINHSDTPNLTSRSVHIEGFNHIILYTTKRIAKGEQLCYDYGPGYWKARPKPIAINKPTE